MAAQDDREDSGGSSRGGRRNALGLGIGGGRHTQQRRLMVKIASAAAAAKC